MKLSEAYIQKYRRRFHTDLAEEEMNWYLPMVCVNDYRRIVELETKIFQQEYFHNELSDHGLLSDIDVIGLDMDKRELNKLKNEHGL